MNEDIKQHRSLFNLNGNIIIFIIYFSATILNFILGLRILSWITPLLIFFLENNSKYVKFHALQALFLEIILILFFFFFGIIATTIMSSFNFSTSANVLVNTLLSSIITILNPIISLICSAVVVYKSWGYTYFKLPFLGNYVTKLIFTNN